MIVPKNKIVTTNKKTLRKNVSKECCIVSINILMPSECRISLSILFKKKVNNSINNQIKLPFFFQLPEYPDYFEYGKNTKIFQVEIRR